MDRLARLDFSIGRSSSSFNQTSSYTSFEQVHDDTSIHCILVPHKTMKVRIRRKDKKSSNWRWYCWCSLLGMALMLNMQWSKGMMMQGIFPQEDVSGHDVPWKLSEKSASFSVTSSLPEFLVPFQSTLETSDFVELDHCDLSSMNWTAFQNFADPVIQSNLPMRMIANDTDLETKLFQEWTLELLELYLTHHDKCRFDQYRPKIQKTASYKLLEKSCKKSPTLRLLQTMYE